MIPVVLGGSAAFVSGLCLAASLTGSAFCAFMAVANMAIAIMQLSGCRESSR